MYASFEEKGKIFTDVVPKQPVEALIQTSQHLIRGFVHIRHDERLKDEINRGETFLAITSAQILDKEGKTLYKAGFIIINREQIIWLLPASELENPEAKNE
ncbi:MAG: hypothetical protein IT308_11215 [Anaerolineaceae bacterium]|nr:hypothetical protein [Anaerolineaceae bacterium]